MDHLLLKIEGGNKISGVAEVAGSKNGCLAILAGTILNQGQSIITNIPELTDVKTFLSIFSALGISANYDSTKKEMIIDASTIATDEAPYELVSKMRASFFIIGPLLARLNTARVPLPGGCSIGARPVDLHLKGLEKLGAEISINHGVVEVKAKKLRGGNINLDFPSVGATQTILMAACLAEGQTIIENAAQEPEVADLAKYCRSLGAEISGEGSPIITINGKTSLKADITHKIIPDRIEVGTFTAMSAIMNCPLTISPVVPTHLSMVLSKYHEMGVEFDILEHSIIVKPSANLKPVSVTTATFPGFPTDMQAQIMSVLTITPGVSKVEETIFENRFLHVAELTRMGANIQVKGRQAVIVGVDKLLGAPVEATDLRASACLILAGLAAEGTTYISGLHHLMRGYENICGRLQSLGAKVELINTEHNYVVS